MAWVLPEDGVLGIFGEKPEVARVGSRLAEEWGPDRAEEIHEAMLLDTVRSWDSPEVLGPGGRRVLVYGPSDAGPWFDDLAPESFALQPQADGDRGRRIHDFSSNSRGIFPSIIHSDPRRSTRTSAGNARWGPP